MVIHSLNWVLTMMRISNHTILTLENAPSLKISLLATLTAVDFDLARNHFCHTHILIFRPRAHLFNSSPLPEISNKSQVNQVFISLIKVSLITVYISPTFWSQFRVILDRFLGLKMSHNCLKLPCWHTTSVLGFLGSSWVNNSQEFPLTDVNLSKS